MNLSYLAGAMALALSAAAPAFAGMTLEERLEQMEARMRHLESRVAAQDEVIRDKDRQIAELKETGGSGGTGGGWWQGVEMSGLVEVEASHTSPFEGDDESDLVVATVELGVEAQVNDWMSANLLLLWEEDEGDVTVDEAFVTFGNADVSPFSFTAGRIVAPFGVFETHMVSDPFTLDLGETKETAALVGYESNGINAAAYAFNGDLDHSDNHIDNFGLSVGYGNDDFNVGLDYISDIGDSDVLADVVDEAAYSDRVGGVAVHAQYSAGPISVIGEYVTAVDDFEVGALEFDGEGARPAAFNIEAGYTMEQGVAGRETTVAVGYQQTKEALAIELPEKRVSVAASVAVNDNATIAVEWAHDTDYDQSEGGTGENADTVTAQLAVEF
ncbi:MAG: LbtU family siderophore porin [Chromatiales bacterium]|nr:LbtU family siderophore porin [Chromatiales bacterium]